MNADERIGRNLVTRRGDRSQKDVADAMRARGWKWSQATVWAIEKGERPLRLAEADDLADVLGDSFHGAYSLLRDPDSIAVEVELGRVRQAHATLVEAMRHYEQARLALATIGDRAEELSLLDHDQIEGWAKRGLSAVVKQYRSESSTQSADAAGTDGQHLTAWRKAK
jgi:hypothetical protein